MIEVLVYQTEDGRAPFAEWRTGIDRIARARVDVAIDRLRAGNISNLKSLGGGLAELKLHFGPGYRIYLGQEGSRIVILLTGGTKQRQDADIERARKLWIECRAERKEN